MLQKLGALDFEKHYRRILWTAIVVTVLFKLLLMGLFSSDYQDLMFITSMGSLKTRLRIKTGDALHNVTRIPPMLSISSITGGYGKEDSS